jgi:hypothetical protein
MRAELARASGLLPKQALTTTTRIDSWWPILLIAGIAVALLLTLRSGQEWDGDFALYIMNARNIVAGIPYAHTGYIPNPANLICPAAYPPGLPLILAPLYAWFGVDLMKMKIVCTVMFVLFLVVLYRIAVRFVPASLALATTAAVGLHPFIVDSGNSLGSEFPFMLFCYSALYLIDRLQERDTTLELRATAVLGTAVAAVAFAYLTRSIGVALFPAAAFVSVYRSKRLFTLTNITLAGAAAVVLVVQHAFPPDVGTYVHYFQAFTPHGLLTAVNRYLSVRMELLGKAASEFPIGGVIIASALALLGLLGFVERLRRKVSVFEPFCVIYLLVLLIFPVRVEAARYAMPLWPLLFLYCAVGIDSLGQSLGAFGHRLLSAAVGFIVVALYCVQYAGMTFGPVPFSVDARQSRELLTQIRADVPQGERVLARKPTIVALYAGRDATVWPLAATDDEIWSYMARLRVTYVVQDIYHLAAHHQANDPLDGFIDRNRSKLELVFKNEWFNLYRVVNQR